MIGVFRLKTDSDELNYPQEFCFQRFEPFVSAVSGGNHRSVVIVVVYFVVVTLRCWACAFHQDKASSVKVLVANVTLFSSAHLLRENTDLVRSNQRKRSTAPSVPLKISLGLVFLLELSEVAMAAACAFRAEEVPSLISCWMASKVMTGVSDVDVLLGGILSTKDDT
ncbi:hypothetical protein Tco_0906726 [Tanacetum coccineum]|uniref:Uncharacterized protein n=1 Tax=Tanacetum coccineum TaxID=301880 RepID=A0ABQ5CHA1_9ASTR